LEFLGGVGAVEDAAFLLHDGEVTGAGGVGVLILGDVAVEPEGFGEGAEAGGLGG
jgi:hypothetical protein